MAEQRNWAELPTDVLSVLFRKVGVIEILKSVDSVCHPWRQFALQPSIWRFIYLPGSQEDPIFMEKLARKAIHRSSGLLDEFVADDFGSDELLSYIADRAPGLKGLTMYFPRSITGFGLARILARCRLLNKCVVRGSVKEFEPRSIREMCPEMKILKLTRQWIGTRYHGDFSLDAEAEEIAKNMPQLQKLTLIANLMTNEGLHAILDNCPHLEYLNIMDCFAVNENKDASLLAKLGKIKKVTLPRDEGEEEDEEDEDDGEDY